MCSQFLCRDINFCLGISRMYSPWPTHVDVNYGNATMWSVIIFALLVAVNDVSKMNFCRRNKKKYSCLCVKFPIFLSGFNQVCTGSMHFHKSLQHANLKNIRVVGAEPIYADGQTDMIKLIDAFHHYSKAISNIFPSICPFLFQILNVLKNFNSFRTTQDTVHLQS
jgi:hypothetical protein